MPPFSGGLPKCHRSICSMNYTDLGVRRLNCNHAMKLTKKSQHDIQEITSLTEVPAVKLRSRRRVHHLPLYSGREWGQVDPKLGAGNRVQFMLSCSSSYPAHSAQLGTVKLGCFFDKLQQTKDLLSLITGCWFPLLSTVSQGTMCVDKVSSTEQQRTHPHPAHSHSVQGTHCIQQSWKTEAWLSFLHKPR